MSNHKIFLFAVFVLSFACQYLYSQDNHTTKIMKMEIRSEIDPRTSRYVNLALDHAEDINADIVILHMDTYGGIVTDAKDIVERILNFKKPIWVYIDKDAASAGALISIACDSIYMAPGGSIGAATVVTADGKPAPDKYQSYMRSTMRSVAEENGRDPKIAEGMVGKSIEVDGVTTVSQVMALSTIEAIKNGYCEAKVNSINDIIERNGIIDYEIIEYHLSGNERIISIFLNPYISGILILIIIGGIYFELQTPGVGFPIMISIIAAILYFVPYYLNGLAENWEIAAFFVGVILIALEIFVIPGFGVAGVSGIVITIGSLVLVMLNNDVFDFSFVGFDEIFVAIIVTLAGFIGSFIVLIIGGSRIIGTKFFSRIALTETMDKNQGYTSNFNAETMTGKKGIAYTVLRPSGKVKIEGEIYDAHTRGDYIDKDQKIIVISDEGTSLKVKSDQ